MKTNSANSSARSIVQFFGLTLVISLPLLVLGAVSGVQLSIGPGLPVSALQFLAPFIAAVIMTGREGGWSAVWRLLSGAVRAPQPQFVRWLAPVVVTMPAIYVMSFGLMSMWRQPIVIPEICLATALIIPLLFLVTAFFEEVGWTSYALQLMHRRWGHLGAALLIGVLWALWHVPADLQSGHDADWIVYQRLGSVVLRILIVWAYLRLGKATFGAIVMHAMDNISWVLFTADGSVHHPLVTTVLAGLVAAALISASERCCQRDVAHG